MFYTRDNIKAHIWNVGERKEFNLDTRKLNQYNKVIEEAREKAHLEGEGILIQDREILRMYVDACIRNDEYVLDVETTGLDTLGDIIVGVCLYTPKEIPAYIPMFHTDLEGKILPNQIPYQQAVQEINRLTASNAKHINHNTKFDHSMLITNFKQGINNIYWDTQLAGKVLNENEKEHGLKYLYARYVAKTKDMQKFKELFKDVPFNFIPLDVAKIYGANDGLKTYKLYEFQKYYLNPKTQFRKIHKLFSELEMPLIPVLADMELRGVQIRDDYTEELRAELGEIREEAYKELLKLETKYKDKIMQHEEIYPLIEKAKGDMQYRINYNSPKQLQGYIYDILKFPSVDRRNPRGTGKDIQEKWEGKKLTKVQQHFLENFQTYKKMDKLITSFVNKLPMSLASDGKIHTNFNQYGAKTGRFSSSDPIHRINLQQIPSRGKGSAVRKMFTAREGYVLIGSDYSQIEPRTLAKLCNDPEMIKAYVEGTDLYSLMASRIFNKSYEECMEFHPVTGEEQKEGKERRSAVKSVLLGIMYGRSPQAIANQFHKPKRWAEQIIANFYEHYPNVKKLQVKAEYLAYKYGFVETILGRKRRLPEMGKTVLHSPMYAYWARRCLNAMIQGSSADIMKSAMLNLSRDAEWQSLDAHMLLTIHDELICEVKAEDALKASQALSRVMKATGEKLINMPMKCDVEITKVWYGEDITEYLEERYN